MNLFFGTTAGTHEGIRAKYDTDFLEIVIPKNQVIDLTRRIVIGQGAADDTASSSNTAGNTADEEMILVSRDYSRNNIRDYPVERCHSFINIWYVNY
mmetsp:Transcript_23194/g.57201  ORF Transcript_23194/g.57201 Transcript_23194/m.57201 type:complete len:97 (-) Transcript_23194:41-331(-)